jgi:hypothetical protein
MLWAERSHRHTARARGNSNSDRCGCRGAKSTRDGTTVNQASRALVPRHAMFGFGTAAHAAGSEMGSESEGFRRTKKTAGNGRTTAGGRAGQVQGIQGPCEKVRNGTVRIRGTRAMFSWLQKFKKFSRFSVTSHMPAYVWSIKYR